MPFGLVNAGATFQRMMEDVLEGIQKEDCVGYLDDVLVHANSFQAAVDILEKVFIRLQENSLILAPRSANCSSVKSNSWDT